MFTPILVKSFSATEKPAYPYLKICIYSLLIFYLGLSLQDLQLLQFSQVFWPLISKPSTNNFSLPGVCITVSFYFIDFGEAFSLFFVYFKLFETCVLPVPQPHSEHPLQGLFEVFLVSS